MICKAAIMAGSIDNKKGGVLSFVIRPPQPSVRMRFFFHLLLLSILVTIVHSVPGLCQKRNIFAVGVAGSN